MSDTTSPETLSTQSQAASQVLTPTAIGKSQKPAKGGATSQKSPGESVQSLSLVHFARPAMIPGHNGAWKDARRGVNPTPGVPGSTFYTNRLALLGNDKLVIGDYTVSLHSGLVEGWLY